MKKTNNLNIVNDDMILAKIESEYAFAGVFSDDVKVIIKNEIDNWLTENKIDKDYNEYIYEKIKTILDKKLIKKLKEKEVRINIINKYLDKNIIDSDEYDVAYTNLQKLALFLIKYRCNLDIDNLYELLNGNQILTKSLSLIVKTDIEFIKSNDIEKYYDNKVLTYIIESYCMFNNIDIDVEADEYLDDFDYSTGSVIGHYYHEVKRPLLTPQKERELAIRIANGDQEAKTIFIESNLRLVFKIAKNYKGAGLALEDLIQYGNIGLIKAVDRFDVNKGFKFSTYATWWIRQAIYRAIADKGRNIHIPINKYEKLVKYNKAIQFLKNQLYREPTDEEVSKETGLSLKTIDEIKKIKNDTLSLNGVISGETDTELEEYIVIDETTPEDIVVSSSLQKCVRDLLEKSNLNSKERKIIMLRFGFFDDYPYTLDDIATMFGVTKERIRQIEAQGIMKIRKSRYIKHLAVYMDNSQKAEETIDSFRNQYINSNGFNNAYTDDFKRKKKVY